MKLKLLTASCLAAFTALPAHALSPAVTASANTIKVFMSGASAQFNVIPGLFETMCVPGTRDTYTHRDATNSVIVTAVSCTITAGVSDFAGKNVVLSYNAEGGSGNGVYPIAKLVDSGGAFTNVASNHRNQIVDPTVCTGASPNWTCTSAALGGRWSDAGVSDVEPAMFVFELNRPAIYATTPLEDFELANMDIGSQFQVIFGIAATNNLYEDLAVAQGLSTGAGQIPSIPRTALISLISGTLSQPSLGAGWQALFTPGTLPANPAVNGTVNIGRRVNGSGTQTAANAFWQTYGCTPTANLLPADALSTNLPEFRVNEGSTTNNVKTFINGRFNAGEYAIGLISKENAPVAGTDFWKHVAIDGFAPSRDNAKTGKYDYVYEQTMQWNVPYLDNFRTAPSGANYQLPAGVTVDNLKNFLQVFRTRSGAPTVLDQISSPAIKEGVTAIANEVEGYIFNDPAGTTEGLANKKFVSRMTRNGNSCQPLLWNK